MNIEEAIIVTIIGEKYQDTKFHINGIKDVSLIPFKNIPQVIMGLRKAEAGCTFRYAQPGDEKVKHVSKLPLFVINYLRSQLGDYLPKSAQQINGGMSRKAPDGTREPSDKPRRKSYHNLRPYWSMCARTKEFRVYNSLRDVEDAGFAMSSVSNAIAGIQGSSKQHVWTRQEFEEPVYKTQERLRAKMEIYLDNTITPIFSINIETGKTTKYFSTRELTDEGFTCGNVYKIIYEKGNQHMGHIFVQDENDQNAMDKLKHRRAMYKLTGKSKVI